MQVSPFVCRWFSTPMRTLLTTQCGLVAALALVVWGSVNGGLRQQTALLQEQRQREQESVAEWQKRLAALPAPAVSSPSSATRPLADKRWESGIGLPTEALRESGGQLISWSPLSPDGNESEENGWLLVFNADYVGIRRFITRLNASTVVPRIDRLLMTRAAEGIRTELLLRAPVPETGGAR
ncbi:hypothetical protein AU490_06930 [Lonsdalea populi]|uniref:Uncharacterized protein n=3 Tax=Pectobacteriaceae TaxID=1903410 RepID=A0ACD1JBR1_9GAMM|nr:hypothetical protein AU508_10540 [Lonsdalea populi]RAT12719.1 hypothetical protein AU485_10990 [Lonsdalea quercina]OSN01023.1 hypothetical protein AU499_08455 [Lonsdalea populi]RAT15710.1 hypothetical protein AU486_09525 [Lonsdalea quercina]RAT17822.1 hypothetical protein AU487_15250 [Lonsdalea populi]